MEILQINDHKVKITLTPKEVARFSLTGRRVEEWGDVRATLAEILKGSTLAPSFLKGRILVQAYPTRDGGCELFVTRLGEEGDAAKATSAQRRTRRTRNKSDSESHAAPDAVEKETTATVESVVAADAAKKSALSVFRFSRREDLIAAYALFPTPVREGSLYRIEGDRYVLVTACEGFGRAHGQLPARMHPLCEFADVLPNSVLECLYEHATAITVQSLAEPYEGETRLAR